MAASRPLCLCNPLCFLVSRFGKRSSKELKSAALLMSLNSILPRINCWRMLKVWKHPLTCYIPSRRGGDDRVTHIVDDIFTVLTHLDENLSLRMLPRYVTDNLDSVPSSRLYEGDLST